MYDVTVRRRFSAAHAITVAGERETRHGHDWRVEVVATGPTLDDDGLLCDFHELERNLAAVLRPFENADLNETPPFDEVNPTAEHVARHIADALASSMPKGTRLRSVSVTEAPGCVATWRGDDP
jgi:6-pyruvoyltetrahydropterin/6-carboxytetrahydropterin synthase